MLLSKVESRNVSPKDQLHVIKMPPHSYLLDHKEKRQEYTQLNDEPELYTSMLP